MIYSITAKQNNSEAKGIAPAGGMSPEKAVYRKMRMDCIEINDDSLAWYILKGIVADFIEYTYDNDGEWSIQISRTPNGGDFDYFELHGDKDEILCNMTAKGTRSITTANHHWDSFLSGWL